MNQTVVILDFGGQYNQLIARRVRECGVYCEVLPYHTPVEKILEKKPIGIIFTGGPNSVYLENAPRCSKEVFELGIPVLGICYGIQVMAHMLGGHVTSPDSREYGKTETKYDTACPLFDGLPPQGITWMSHTDYISKVPEGFRVIAQTEGCPVAAMENQEKKLYAFQFHPEVEHSREGIFYLKNFLYGVCGCKGDWVMSSFVKDTIQSLKEKIGDKKVLCALSGGVDSSVAALLVHKAVGKQLTCIFVDHGLLRKDEGDQVETVFRKQFDMNLIRVNAKDRFLSKISGSIRTRKKNRKIIGEEFIRVFEEESQKLGKIEFLCQGTIYPDVVESGVGEAAVIKSHHNVGGLPEDVGFEGIIEPLRDLFKDEVRQAVWNLESRSLSMEAAFPGPRPCDPDYG